MFVRGTGNKPRHTNFIFMTSGLQIIPSNMDTTLQIDTLPNWCRGSSLATDIISIVGH